MIASSPTPEWNEDITQLGLLNPLAIGKMKVDEVTAAFMQNLVEFKFILRAFPHRSC